MATTPQTQSPRAPFTNATDIETDETADIHGQEELDDTTMTFEPQSSGVTRCVGAFLSIGAALVGYADGLNGIIDVRSFNRKACKEYLGEHETDTCIDQQWYRLAYTLGSILGALLGGLIIAGRFGRRVTVSIGALVSIAGSVCMFAYVEYHAEWSSFARGVQGAGASMVAFAIPLLWVETAAKRSRGFLGGLLLFMLYVGVSSWYLVMAASTADTRYPIWQGLYVLAFVFAVALLLGSCDSVPESPRWVHYFHSKYTTHDTTDGDSTEAKSEPTPRKLTEPTVLKRVVIASLLLSLNQYFSLVDLVQMSDILQDVSEALSDTDIPYKDTSRMLAHGFNSNNLTIGIFIAIPSLISLRLVDKAGRRILLLIGAVCIGFFQFYADFAMEKDCKGEIFQRKCRDGSVYSMASLAAIVTYGLTWGPVMWIYPFEMFPTEVRARGVALTTAASTALVMSLKEFSLELFVNPYVPFGCCVVALVVVGFCCPETKRLSLEEAEAQF